MTLINLLKVSSWSLVLLKAHLGVRLYRHSELARLVDRAETLSRTLHYLHRKIAHPEAVKSLQQLAGCVRKCLSMFGIGKQPPSPHCGMCHHSELAELASIAAAVELAAHDEISNEPSHCIKITHMEHTDEITTRQQDIREMIEACLALIQQNVLIPALLLTAVASLHQQQPMLDDNTLLQPKEDRLSISHTDTVAIDLLFQQSTEARRLPPQEHPLPEAIQPTSFPISSPSGSDSSDYGTTPTTAAACSSSLRPSSSARKLTWIGSGESFNRVLHSKRLRFTHVRLRDVTYELSIVINTIQQSQNLQELNLSSNDIGDDGAVAIAEAMGRSNSLNTIVLGYNEIAERGAKALSDAIIRSACLTKLDLTSNDIGNVGAIAIAEAIIQTNGLQSLSLGNNEISARGTTALAEAIKPSTCMTFIDLSFNHIRTAGANAMADCIRHNTSLSFIDLSETMISNEGLAAILQAMQSTPRIKVKL